MALYLLAAIAGALTILSPCILPVLPFVFARSDRSFARSGLPILTGMGFTFVAVSSLSFLAGDLASSLSSAGRVIALVFLTWIGLSFLFPHLSEKIFAPLTRAGVKIGSNQKEDSLWGTFLIGVSTGFLWAPCAGPILGLILTGAASQGSHSSSVLLLTAYALGAISILGIAIFAGAKFFATMKKALAADVWIKRSLGVLVLAGVVVIAFHLDRTILTQISKVETGSLETSLLDHFLPQKKNGTSEGEMPELPQVEWINSPPLTKESLKGKVVLVDFWTYSCINCLRTLPYLKAWNEKYKSEGLVIIGVHTPEFPFEKEKSNIQKAVDELGIHYPVAIDSDYKIWNAFGNQYWPAHYFIDKKGQIRHHHFGEGEYDESEKMIRELLAEDGGQKHEERLVSVSGSGVQEAPSTTDALSPETYLGYARAQNFVAHPEALHDAEQQYEFAPKLNQNEWSLAGKWMISGEKASLAKAGGEIRFRFHSRDLHLVLGSEKPVRFKVTLDGKAPAGNHGTDIDKAGAGIIQGHRLYQLIRQNPQGELQDHTFEIEFLDSGAEAYAFTFG